MIPSESFYRKKDPTSSSSTCRYIAADFDRLTNRRISSPHFTPDSAHEPSAEYPNNGRTATTADRRVSDPRHASDSLPKAQASRQSSAIRKASWSSVKEEEGGKLQNLPS